MRLARFIQSDTTSIFVNVEQITLIRRHTSPKDGKGTDWIEIWTTDGHPFLVEEMSEEELEELGHISPVVKGVMQVIAKEYKEYNEYLVSKANTAPT